jgi:hypothetical protein
MLEVRLSPAVVGRGLGVDGCCKNYNIPEIKVKEELV